jgi:hypothetical protein
MTPMGNRPDVSWKIMPVRSGHYYIPEMKISKPKNEALSSNLAYFFQHSIEKSIITLVRPRHRWLTGATQDVPQSLILKLRINPKVTLLRHTHGGDSRQA